MTTQEHVINTQNHIGSFSSVSSADPGKVAVSGRGCQSMEIGVYLSDMRPIAGGGFTFEDEVFSALLRHGAKGNHRFCVFTRQSQLDIPREADFLRVVQLPLRRPFDPLSLLRPLNLITKKGRQSSRRRRRGWKSNWIERIILGSGVDMMWYPSPGAVTTELPYVTVVWDLQHRRQPFFPEVSSGGEWNAREQLHKTELSRATYVVAGTEVGKAEIERFYGVLPERIRILPHPTPRFALCAASGDDRQVIEDLGVPENYLFYPAQFWPHKNHANLLHALALLKEQHGLKLPLVLVGSEKGNQSHIKQLGQILGIDSQIHHLGFVTREQLVALYRRAAALVYMTLFGPENLPPLEAFALECPVIASDVPGAREQMGDAALFVDPLRPESIAAAIKRLHTDREMRQDFIEKGKMRARRFTGDDFIRGVFDIFDEFSALRRCWAPGDVISSK